MLLLINVKNGVASPFEDKIILNHIYRFISHLTANTLHVHYIKQSVDVVFENNRPSLKESCETNKYNLC
jgi:hypothetical protein